MSPGAGRESIVVGKICERNRKRYVLSRFDRVKLRVRNSRIVILTVTIAAVAIAALRYGGSSL